MGWGQEDRRSLRRVLGPVPWGEGGTEGRAPLGPHTRPRQILLRLWSVPPKAR